MPVAVAAPAAKEPMPSSASGVGKPSDIVEPVWLKVT